MANGSGIAARCAPDSAVAANDAPFLRLWRISRSSPGACPWAHRPQQGPRSSPAPAARGLRLDRRIVDRPVLAPQTAVATQTCATPTTRENTAPSGPTLVTLNVASHPPDAPLCPEPCRRFGGSPLCHARDLDVCGSLLPGGDHRPSMRFPCNIVTGRPDLTCCCRAEVGPVPSSAFRRISPASLNVARPPAQRCRLGHPGSPRSANRTGETPGPPSRTETNGVAPMFSILLWHGRSPAIP